MGLWITLGVVAVLVLWVIVSYNGLVRGKLTVENSFAQIDTQLQRRYDLIPNLIETVKGYMTHEKDVFEKITLARSASAIAKTIEEKAEAHAQTTGALNNLYAVAENYPDLKASSNFAELQTELTNTENKIAFSRQFYNDSVMRYNSKLMTFPTNMIAGMFNFESSQSFEVDTPEARKNVKVQF